MADGTDQGSNDRGAEDAALTAAYRAAAGGAPYFCPPYEDVRAAPGFEVLRLGSGPLPVVVGEQQRKFTVGERKLGTLTVRAASLPNPWLLEGLGEDAIADALREALGRSGADVLEVGEVPTASRLRAALGALSWPHRPLAKGRKDSVRWLIDLPDTFDAYMKTLSSSTRQSQKRKMRKLEKDFDVALEVVTEAAQVPRFLAEGEAISRLTYQWNVGQRLEDDAATRARYEALCEAGRLRCYLMSLDGTPRAFLRGTVEGGLYHYETPGFDPDYGRSSVGTVLLLYALRDLIEETDVSVFDFGTGGDETGYKSTYGNRSLACADYAVVRMDRLRGAALWAAQTGLNRAKDAASLALRDERLRRAMKRMARQYGG